MSYKTPPSPSNDLDDPIKALHLLLALPTPSSHEAHSVGHADLTAAAYSEGIHTKKGKKWKF